MKEIYIRKAVEALKVTEHDTDLNPLRQQALKTNLLERITRSNFAQQPIPKTKIWILNPAAFTALIIIVSCSIAGGAAYATQNSLPGDILHPLKLAAEEVEIKLTPSEDVRVQIEARHADERLKELTRIQEQSEIETTAAIQKEPEEMSRHEAAQVMTKDGLEKALNLLEQRQKNLEIRGNTERAEEMKEIMHKLQEKAATSRFKIQREKKRGEIRVRIITNEDLKDESNEPEDETEIEIENQEEDKSKIEEPKARESETEENERSNNN